MDIIVTFFGIFYVEILLDFIVLTEYDYGNT